MDSMDNEAKQKKIIVLQVMGLKHLGRVGTHIFFSFFLEKYDFMHFERHKIIFFPEKLLKILGFTSKFW